MARLQNKVCTKTILRMHFLAKKSPKISLKCLSLLFGGCEKIPQISEKARPKARPKTRPRARLKARPKTPKPWKTKHLETLRRCPIRGLDGSAGIDYGAPLGPPKNSPTSLCRSAGRKFTEMLGDHRNVEKTLG